MKRFVGVILALAAGGCASPAETQNPCPNGICVGETGAGGRGSTGPGAGPGGNGTGTCMEAWSCTPWTPDGNGQYTRTCVDINQCGTTNQKPDEGPVTLPALDMEYYKCKVEPIVDRGCAMLGCHGNLVGRAYHLYARGRLRNDETVPQVSTCLDPGSPKNLNDEGTATVMCLGWSAHTPSEWQQNYDIARSFMIGLDNPDDCDLLMQPKVGGKIHAGVHLFAEGDASYQTIRAWLGGATLGGACNPGSN